MYDVDYKKWADYIESIFLANNVKPELVLDLGCGTGNLCIEMAKRGYDMIGVDLSTDMLSCAKDKSDHEGVDVLYLNQDIVDFELYGTVDAVVCLMDTINYVVNKKDLKRLFKLVKNYLNPNGLFIFDINSEYKFKTVLNKNIFYDIGDDVTYLWENVYDRKRKICEFELTFFVKNNDSYIKYDEIHYERAYSKTEIKEIIENANMELVGIYNELTNQSPRKKSERIFFVCQNR